MSYLTMRSVTQSSGDLQCLVGVCDDSGNGGDSNGIERAQGMRSMIERSVAYLNSKGCVSQTCESDEQILM